MCMRAVSEISLDTMFIPRAYESEKWKSDKPGARDGWKPPCGCWDSNMDPLQKQ